MHDVQAILDEIGSERAALFGVSEGGPMSLLYASYLFPNARRAVPGMAHMPSAVGRQTIPSGGKLNSGSVSSETWNITGERLKEPVLPCGRLAS